MITTHDLWTSILSCSDRNYLSSGAWKKLHKIAEQMSTEDFSSGTEKELGRKLLKALGYESWKELKEESQLQIKINFINECEERAKGYKSIDNFFTKVERVKLGDAYHTGEMAKRKYYEYIKSLGMFRSQHKDGFMPVKRAMIDLLDDMDPIDKFREERMKHLSAEKVKAQKKK